MTAMPPELQAFDHVHVYVADRARAEAWYAEVLGLRRCEALAFWAADGGPLTLQNAAGTIHIALFERPPQPCRSVVALRVDAASYRAWQAHLGAALRGEVSEEHHDVSISLYFRDPDGNPYELTTYEVAGLGRPPAR